MKGKGIIFTLLGGGLLYFLYKKYSNWNTFAKNLAITPKLDGGIGKVSISKGNLKIPLAIVFHNYSKAEVEVAVNNLVVYQNGKTIATLRPNSQSVMIKAESDSTLTGLKVEIPLLKLLTVLTSAIATKVNNGDFSAFVESLSVRITCTIARMATFEVTVKLGQTAETSGVTIGLNGKPHLGVVAKAKRVLKPFSDYEMYIPAKTELLRRDLILVPDGSTQDTVHLMHEVARKYASDTRELAKVLRRETLKDTLQSIFDFVYNYIQYVPDSRTREQVRRPLRTLWDREGDCDCYATLIGSILHNMGIGFKFRIAAYNGRQNFQHVYVIVPYSGGYYVCDPVLDRCFDEKQPSKYQDF